MDDTQTHTLQASNSAQALPSQVTDDPAAQPEPAPAPKESVVSVFTAARYLCGLAKWKLSEQEIQKMLYFAQMLSLGEKGQPIFNEGFQAWRDGPVCPDLHKELKIYGESQVIHIEEREDEEMSEDSKKYIDTVWDELGDLTPRELTDRSHREGSAWYDVTGGTVSRFAISRLMPFIPEDRITAEYHKYRALAV